MLRDEFLLTALSKENSPYVWGAKGPDRFDCSGLVTFCLRKAGLGDVEAAALFGVPATVKPARWQEFVSAQKLFDNLKATTAPLPGDLAFYGSGLKHITHVVICTGDGRIIGANGGGSNTLSPTPSACVKFRKSPTYRPDLRGYRSLPCH